MTNLNLRKSFCALFLTIVPSVVHAEDAAVYENGDDIEKVVVYGRAEQLIGKAKSASDGVVGYDDFCAIIDIAELDAVCA